jgi:SAM-dependent methyltransferase
VRHFLAEFFLHQIIHKSGTTRMTSDGSIPQITDTKLAFGAEPSKRTYRLRLARYKALAEAVAAYVTGAPAPDRFCLLDVGAGSGRSMRYIEAEKVAHLIDFSGLDLKHRRLKSVYSPERWRLYQGDIQNRTPFESGSFDIVLCEQVVEHLDDPAAAMREIARVLKPGGLLVMGVPIFPWGVSHLRRLIVHVSKKYFGISHSHVQTFNNRSVTHLVGADNRFVICSMYGLRTVSGGVLSKLEDFRWWFRFNRWFGHIAPSLCTEIQVVARRTLTE